MLDRRRNILRIAVALVVLFTLPRPADAGPLLIRHPFDAGAASLLPWGTGPGWNTPLPSCDVQQLTADTLRLLTAEAPILARMENMRRATIYASQDRRVATELLAAVLGRALTAAAHAVRDPLPGSTRGISSSPTERRA